MDQEATRLSEVQPIDGYVKMLLGGLSKKYNIAVDLEHPTRGQRLEVAVAARNESSGFSSMELMVGRRISNDEPLVGILLIQQICPQDPSQFYEGFAHGYWPAK